MKTVEQYASSYRRVFIFDFDQTSSDKILQLRLKVKDIGRVFVGRNSLVAVTLKAIGSRTNRDYDELLKQISGHRGLLFSNIDCKKLVRILDKEQPEFMKKLLGYAQLSPGSVESSAVGVEKSDGSDSEMELDCDEAAKEGENVEIIKKNRKKTKSRKKKKKVEAKFEVKFVKV